MIACCSSSPNIPRPASIVPEPNPKPQISVPKPDSEPSQVWKLKSSSHLQRWSRARALRSGRKLDRPSRRTVQTLSPELLSDSPESDIPLSPDASPERSPAKSIYMVSDGTGWTAEHSVNAALGQFDHCLVDRACPVQTHLFSGIEDSERLVEIVKQAAKEGAMVAYTLAEPAMAESARQACELWGVAWTDILGPLTEAVASHLGVSPSGLPRGRKAVPLSEEYFRRIEAVEFTIKHDDGALPQKLHEADVVLAGVSRTGKTPLSIYLAQKGLKVANVPIVVGVGVPASLARADPEKVFGLTINPVVLQAIRRARAKTLGLGDDVATSYSDMGYVRKEIEFAQAVFAQNPVWPVIEVTGKAIEETAAIILRLYQDRKNKCSIPRISKRY